LPVLHFALGSAEPLDPATVHQIAEQLHAHPELKRVRIHGHSDDTGNPQHNLELARRPASSVARALVAEASRAKSSRLQGLDQRGLRGGHGRRREPTTGASNSRL
jgi:outer membrane protein OmpA-like peptidoglycan-associated protein